jgi:DnaJ-class molecular chaperone
MSDPRWAAVVQAWAADPNRPRLCGRCGGMGKRRKLLRRSWRECTACHGTGGAIDDERAWWTAR